MSNILMSIIGFLLAIGILVTVHEAGHFWVARYFGIRVLRFSIGFGRPLFNWFDKSGTEYVIASIPLGGYVSLLGEKGQHVSGSDQFQAYSYKPVWVRMAVLLAGPGFNFLLAILAYWLMFIIGITSIAPVLGNVPKGSIAELAGLHAKQEIISIEGRPTPSWEKVSIALMDAIGKEHTVAIEVREGKGNPLQAHTLDLSSLEIKGSAGDIIKDVGFVPLDPFPPVVGRILPETPAEKAGLLPGDRILGIDNQNMHSRAELNEYVQHRIGENVQLNIERNGKMITLTIKPMSKVSESGKTIGFMGIEYQRGQKIPAEFIRLEKYGFIDAFWQATKRTAQYIVMTFQVLKKMLLGTLSIKQISGPIAIAQYAGYTVSMGIEYFLSFLAVISIGLGVINLLPIPLLDGGQLMYCLFELISGRALPDKAQRVGVLIGGGILLALTFIAFYNDIIRLVIKD